MVNAAKAQAANTQAKQNSACGNARRGHRHQHLVGSHRYVREESSAAARSLAGVHLQASRIAVPGTTELRGSISRSLGRAWPWRRPLHLELRRQLFLFGAAAVGEPHRQCAGRQARSGHRRPCAAEIGQQSDDGRDVSSGPQGRRRRGCNHAAIARQGAGLSDPEGGGHAGTVRRQTWRRTGKSKGHRAESETHRLLGHRRSRLTGNADIRRKPAIYSYRYGRRRCLPDRFYVGDYRRAQGHHAFSP